MTYSMYYHYYRMQLDDLPPLKVRVFPSTPDFLEQLNKHGFVSSIERSSYSIYYQVKDKLPFVERTGKTLLLVLIAKNQKTDFYSDPIDKDIQLIRSKIKDEARIHNQIVLQFKPYEALTPQTKTDLDAIINYVENNRALVHITCGFNPIDSQIYYLRPKKNYPNKYYYAATRWINLLCGIEEVPQ